MGFAASVVGGCGLICLECLLRVNYVLVVGFLAVLVLGFAWYSFLGSWCWLLWFVADL